MDPMNQSAQITSSQGLADGQISAPKESKVSDSFLSSSPVSLIQSPQDKRVVLGSDKPSEVVATSLRYASQPGSFSPGNYGAESGRPDGQPESPIKTSPVSERIKALEALAAKKKEPEFRNDGGFSHFRDRHIEKAPAEKITPAEKVLPAPQKKGGSVNSESPESPFEVLGDLGQVNEFENTADWMRAHLPPAPDFDEAVDLRKDDQLSENDVTQKEVKEAAIVIPGVPAAFTSVPDSLPKAPFKDSKLEIKIEVPPKQPSAEDDSEFDLRFLPTACMWEQENLSTKEPINPAPISPASPALPTGLESTSPPISPLAVADAKQKDLEATKTPGDVDMDPTEAPEVDSSGESDDTVIEDGASHPITSESASSVPAPSKNPTPNPLSSDPSLPDEEKEKTPLRVERKLMQVPTINVIETDEPNYSDEEMEMEMEEEDDQRDDFVKDTAQDAPRTPEPPPETTNTEHANTRPLETEFMEGYSPPSSPVESDSEYSPTHKLPKSEPDPVRQESTIKTHVLQNTSVEFPQTQPERSQISSSADNKNNNFSSFKTDTSFTKEDIELSESYDEWSDERQDILIKPDKMDITAKALPNIFTITDTTTDTDAEQIEALPPCKPSFMQDDLYERQSFDDGYDASPSLDDTPNQNYFDGNDQVPSSSDASQIHIEVLSANTTKYKAPKDVASSEDVILLDEEPLPKPVGGQPSLREYPKDPYSSFGELPSNKKEPVEVLKATSDPVTDTAKKIESIPQENTESKSPMDTDGGPHTPDTTSDPESIEPDCSVSRATDSFVDFMKECLKSRQDPEAEDAHQDVEVEQPGSEEHALQSPPKMVMDLEQEELTISALKELGSSQEEEDDVLMEKTTFKPHSEITAQDKMGPGSTGVQQSPRIPTSTPLSPQASPTSESTYSKEVEAIDQWVAEAYYLAEHVLTAILTHLSVKDLIHWRDPKKSGVVFGVSLLVLLSLAAFSVISVVSYLLLALLCVTITFRIYKSVVQAVQKSGDGHPFKTLMDKDVSIPPETFRKHVDASLTYINRALKQMSRLFLVEDLVDSLKLAVGMWLLTYVGAVFNGITILILADILLFAVPPVYEKNKTQIDQYIDVVRTQVNSTMAKLQEKLPGSMKRSKTE